MEAELQSEQQPKRLNQSNFAVHAIVKEPLLAKTGSNSNKRVVWGKGEVAHLEEGCVAFLLRNLAGAVKHIGVGSLGALSHQPSFDDIQGGSEYPSDRSC